MAFRDMVIDETDDIESYSEPSLCLENLRRFLHSSIYPQDYATQGYDRSWVQENKRACVDEDEKQDWAYIQLNRS